MEEIDAKESEKDEEEIEIEIGDAYTLPEKKTTGYQTAEISIRKAKNPLLDRTFYLQRVIMLVAIIAMSIAITVCIQAFTGLVAFFAFVFFVISAISIRIDYLIQKKHEKVIKDFEKHSSEFSII